MASLNAQMNIRIQVLANQARRAIQQVEGDITRMAASNAAAAVTSGRANDSLARSFQRMGSQVQWAGRQIAYNFSLPLAAAAAAGAKFALDNERAFTRVSKVYGDGSLAIETVNNELEALKKNFTALSEVYGVNRVEVTNIAADWAAAGASGASLAKSVELTMKTMVLGEMEAADATRALIAIQSQYGFNTEQLTDTIGQLNIVENQTGTSMQDLVDSMSRSAGVARAAGIDVRHLAAMTAALVPAAGTASQAGNALKTIISRLLSPTQEAAQILNEMGIATDSMAWKSADGAARVKILSESYEGLSDAQKAVASAALGGRQQLNKFEVLLEAVANDGTEAGSAMSYYYKALEATSDRTAYMLQLQKELDTVLASNPKKWDTVKVMLQNALGDAIAPLLPYLIGMAREVANLAKKWGELNPSVQKAIGVVALFLIVLGPAMSLVGAFVTMIGYLGGAFKFILAPFGMIISALWSLVSALLITPAVTVASAALGAFGAFMATLSAGILASTRFMVMGFQLLYGAMPLIVTVAGAAIGAAWTAVLALVSGITIAWGPSLTAAWATIQFALQVITAELGGALRLVWMSVLSGLSVLTATWGAAMGVMWRTMGLSWAVGLRSPYALMLALTAGFAASMTMLWTGMSNFILLTILQPFRIMAVALYRSMMVALATIQVAGGFTFQAIWAGIAVSTTKIWQMLGISMSVITAQISRGVVIIWTTMTTALTTVLLTFAKVAGIVWRAWGVTMAVITAEVGAGIAGVWRAMQALLVTITVTGGATLRGVWASTLVLLEAVLIAGAAALGAIWRSLQVVMATTSAVFAPLLLRIHSTLMLALGTITATYGATFTRLWTMISISASVISAQMSRGVVIIWTTMTTALTNILLIFARAAGVIWRAWGVTMAVITAELSAGIAGVWRALQALLVTIQVTGGAALRAAWAATVVGVQAVIIAGAAAIGAVWRSLQVALVTIQLALGPVLMRAVTLIGGALTIAWTAISTGLLFVWSALQKGMVLLFSGGMKLLMAIATRGYAGLISIVTAGSTILKVVMTSPWTWVVLAIAAILYMLRDKIAEIWNGIVAYFQDANNGIVKAFNNLPRGITNALIAVVTVVRDAALQVYEWFSYLNPFAHHSPSLVENVTRGMAIVRSEYGKIVDIKGPIDSAYASIRKFKEASRGLMDGMDSINRAKDRKSMVEAGVSDAVLGSFDELVGKLSDMKRRQDSLSTAVTNQENAVTIWKDRLDAANDALDLQKDRLEAVQNVADSYKDSIDALRDEITNLASAPLQGIGAMEDALFDNEMAQNRLRLAMLKTAADGGMSFDDLKSKIASINGAIEGLSGEKAGLRSMGAGGEILGFYDEQIKALEGQKKALNAAGAPIEKMQTELEKLQQQAEIMDLEKSLKFDPLTRAIDKAANGMKELPFDQMMSGITTNQAALVGLEANYARATAAVAGQQAAVDQAQAASNAIQAAYDLENQKLDALKQVYDAATTSVRDMESALTDAASAARLLTETGASEYVTPGLQNFRDAEGGDFPDVGAGFNVGREGGLGDQSGEIEDLTSGLNEELAKTFDGFDMWAPFKDMWNAVVIWWDANVGPWITGIADFFSTAFDGVDLGGTVGGWFSDAFGGIDWAGIWTSTWETITSTIQNIWDIGSLIVDLFGEDFQATIDDIVMFFSELWRVLQTMWADIKERIDPFLEALGNLWTIIQVIAAVVIGSLVMGFQTLWSILQGVLGPAIHMIVGVFENLWDIVKGVIDVFIGLFTLDFGKVFSGLGEIFGGIVGILWDVIVGIGSMIWGAISGLATGVWDNMKWLASMLWEGFKSGVDTAWDAVYGFFEGIIGGIIDWVKSLFGINSPSTIFAEIGEFLLEGLINGLQAMWNAVTGFFSGLWDAIGDVINWAYENIIKPIWNAMVTFWERMLQGFENIYNQVLKPLWDALGTAMDWLWKNLLKPIWDAMGTAWDTMLRGFKTIWEQVLKPVWTAIETAMDWLWKTILKPIWDAMKAGWETLGTGMKWVWDNVLKPMFDTFSTIVGGLRSVFDTVVGAIGTAWDGIKEKARTPINFVIETVLNNGLIKAFNSVVGFFGLDSWKIQPLSPIALAKGGAVPGYSPTDRADNIPARLTAGEFVQPVKAVERYGRGFMESIRTGDFPVEQARQYANGGWVDLFNALKEQGGFTRANDNSTFRRGDTGFHGRGLAVDLGEKGFTGGNGRPYLAAMNEWIYDNKGAVTTELIYDGLGDNRADLKRGRPLNYGYALQQQHKNHVHLAAENVAAWVNSGTGAAAFAGASTTGSSAAVRENPSWWSDPIKYIRDAAENLMGGVPAGGKIGDWAKKTPGRMVDNVKDWLIDKINPLGWLNGTTNLSGKEIDMGPATGSIREIVQGVAAQRGWGDGGQWSALSSLVNKESSWNPNAQNRTSTAYGLFQFLNSTWAGTGYAKTSDPRIQSQAGMAYIAKRYGTPLEAWRFHQRNNHYDTGGILESGTTGTNLSGHPERVLSPRQTIAFERMVDILDSGALLSAVARDRGAERMQAQTIVYGNVTGDTTTTYNFYGDLEFPNIKDGDDAEVFIRNLGDLAGK